MKDVTLNQREQARLQVLNSVMEYQLPRAQAAEILGISERQVRRILAAYRRDGAAALVHGNRGRKPRNSVPEDVAATTVILASEKYSGFNHSHLTEVLAEREGIQLSRQTISRLLHRHGLNSARGHRPPQASCTPGAYAPGGHAAADRRQPPPLAGGQRAQIRIAAGSGRRHRHGGQCHIPTRGGHSGLLPAHGWGNPTLWHPPGSLR